MTHIALLGDSVIDNGAYVGGGPDVAQQLRMLVPGEWHVSQHAVDGAVIADVRRQFADVSTAATHIVISAGGNDALRESSILDAPARSTADVIMQFANIQDRFRGEYARLLDIATRHRLPIAVCTIYDPRFPDPVRRRLGSVALSVLNDVITREALARDITLIDLRLMFDNDSDFANPIEPSVQGGLKLARGIHQFATRTARSAVIR